jgi:hypothetical protein
LFSNTRSLCSSLIPFSPYLPLQKRISSLCSKTVIIINWLSPSGSKRSSLLYDEHKITSMCLVTVLQFSLISNIILHFSILLHWLTMSFARAVFLGS